MISYSLFSHKIYLSRLVSILSLKQYGIPFFILDIYISESLILNLTQLIIFLRTCYCINNRLFFQCIGFYCISFSCLKFCHIVRITYFIIQILCDLIILITLFDNCQAKTQSMISQELQIIGIRNTAFYCISALITNSHCFFTAICICDLNFHSCKAYLFLTVDKLCFCSILYNLQFLRRGIIMI